MKTESLYNRTKDNLSIKYQNISNIKPQIKEVIMEIRTDVVCKSFFINNRRFSSLCNAILFQRETLIEKDSLSNYQNEETNIINQQLGIRRIRDIIKKADIHGFYSLIAIENQSDIDKSMPLRNVFMIYLTTITSIKIKTN